MRHVFHQIKQVSGHYFLKKMFMPQYRLLPLLTSNYMYIRPLDNVHMSLRLLIFL